MAEIQGATEQLSGGLDGATGDGLQEATNTGLGSTGEQSVANQATGNGPEELTFFDPASIQGKPELETAYKQMQRAFVEKTQSIAGERRKVEAYNAFEADPIGTIKALAQQYGVQLQAQPQQQTPQEFGSWDDVMAEATNRAKTEIMKDLSPLLGKVQSLQQQNIESYLDNHHPDWRTYEDSMMELIQKHPTLAKDPSMVYEMALPPQVRQARATQAALAKINAGSGAAQVSGGSTTNKQVSNKPNGPMSFADAYAFAKQQLNR